MNILYLYSEEINPIKGGVERVTFVLSNYFRSKGHKVLFLGLKHSNLPFQYTFPDIVNACSKQNLDFLIHFIKKEKINITIFQEGVSSSHTKWLNAVKQTDSKLISCIHNSMIGGIVNMKQSSQNRLKKYHLQSLIFLLKLPFIPSLIKWIYCIIMHPHYKRLCKVSDKVVLLSNSFKKELNLFINANKYNNITAIPNPVSFPPPNVIPTKKKKILYVGRIDIKQKRVNLLIQIWEKIWEKFPDWSLDIVGDGVELEKIRKYVQDKSIQNIKFHGFQDPFPFYQDASIFCMTSSFEGFGIVLIEAMQNGVVPIAFNSYLSVTDIITDKINGFLVPPMNINEYANTLSSLIMNPEQRRVMSSNCFNKAKEFSIEKIGERWLRLLKSMLT